MSDKLKGIVADLNAMKAGGDTELQHVNADNLLIDALIELGAEDVARAFDSAADRCGFWYA
jgi:hypothetical protein